MELDPNNTFELSKDMEVEKEYRNYFFKKEIVKMIYLLDELNEDKHAKHMLRHLANDKIDSGSEILRQLQLILNVLILQFKFQNCLIYKKRFLINLIIQLLVHQNSLMGEKFLKVHLSSPDKTRE